MRCDCSPPDCFFFSSRRRHTRCLSDWSSDVCSSDLDPGHRDHLLRRYALFTLVGIAGEDDLDAPDLGAAPKPSAELPRPGSQSNGQAAAGKIGRASCRGKGEISGVAVYLKKKKK